MEGGGNEQQNLMRNTQDYPVSYTEPQGGQAYQQNARPSYTQVVVQPVATYVVAPSEWTWCHLVTSMISMFCCQIFGFIALVMSLLAYTDHRVKDFAGYNRKKKNALGFGIAAIVIGSIVIVCVVIAIVLTKKPKT